MTKEEVAGEICTCMRGMVSLENNGGFLQLSADLPAPQTIGFGRYTGLRIRIAGNAQIYGVHLKACDLASPWQSYRQQFLASPGWSVVHLPFAGFKPHRTTRPLRPAALRRVGIVAIGRAFEAEICMSDIALYAAPAAPA